MTWEVYIERIGCDRFWGGSAELAAVREIADRPIFILSATLLDVDLVRALQQSMETGDDPIALLYNGTHYNNVILPCTDGSPSAPLRPSALFFELRFADAATDDAVFCVRKRAEGRQWLILARAALSSAPPPPKPAVQDTCRP